MGFTRLEVLGPLVAILSLAVVAIIEGFAQDLRLLELSGAHQSATHLADEKVREVLQAGAHTAIRDRAAAAASRVS